MVVARGLGSRFRLRESRIVSLVDIACTTRVRSMSYDISINLLKKIREESSALGKITISCSLRSPSDTVITSTPVAQRRGLPPLI